MSRLKCPYCGEINSMVIDTRATLGWKALRRIRECRKCKAHFTTYEIGGLDKDTAKGLVTKEKEK